MFTITRVEVFDEANFNQMHCQQCNSKIGWKPRSTRVHFLRSSRRAAAKQQPFGLTCLRCKTNYLITTDGE